MNREQLESLDIKEIDLYELRVGDYFVEAPYYDMYQVTRYEGNRLIGRDIDTEEEVEFMYTIRAYGPHVFKVINM